MRTTLECFPCFIRQTIIALSQLTEDPAVHEEIVREVLSVMQRTDAIGTILEWTSPEFQRQYHAAELVISKGQGNFETLIGNSKKTYFLFQSKCDVVS